jgi:hypothetical protein
MTLFTDPHPEELLFSAWVRSAERLHYPNKNTYFAEITGHQYVKPIIDFPCHLDRFIATLSVSSTYTVDFLIQAHTLYPYYHPFLSADRAQMLYKAMRGENGKRIYWNTNLMNSPVPRQGWFRYCPSCVIEDRAKYGECYWHRLHQIHGVLVCPKHHLVLESCTAEEQYLAKQVFVPADRLLHSKSGQEMSTLSDMEMAERIASQIAFLLEHPQHMIDLNRRYHLLLKQRHFLTSNGVIRQAYVKKAFEEMFSETLLQALHCKLNPRIPAYKTWLGRFLSKEMACLHPLMHVLIIIFLQGSIEEFFQPLQTLSGPFGPGPWPCLNPACPHYRHFVITTCQVFQAKENQNSTGHFTCSCGFKYMRILSEEADLFRKDATLSYGELWTQKLCDLWTESQLSRGQIAKQMNVSERVIQRQVVLLGLSPRTLRVSATSPCQRQKRTVKDRQQWLSALAEANLFPRKQFWQKYQSLIYRLRDYDNEWFEAHPLPPSPKRQNSQNHHSSHSPRWVSKEPINWSERDAQLVEAIQQAVITLKNPQEKPKRVTMSKLTRAVPELGWLNHRKMDRYTQSRNLLEAVLETKETFVLRKIHWLMHTWEEQQIWLGRRRFLAMSGAYHLLLIPSVKEGVNQALAHLSEVFPGKSVILLS